MSEPEIYHLADGTEQGEHENSPDCWCEPYLYYTASNGTEIWVHHDKDGGSAPPEVLAEAIVLASFNDDDSLNVMEDTDC